MSNFPENSPDGEIRGTGILPVKHTEQPLPEKVSQSQGQDGPATAIQGQDGPATGIQGQDGPATGIQGQDGPATGIQGQDGPATGIQGQDGPATGAIRIRQGAYLPHWTRDGGIYAITFRLADSLPPSVVKAWKNERAAIVARAQRQNRALTNSEQKELQRLFSDKVEKYLDAGHGACWMKRLRSPILSSGLSRTSMASGIDFWPGV